MKLTNQLSLALGLSIASTAAIGTSFAAAGSSSIAMPQSNLPGLYVEAQLGYGLTNLRKILGDKVPDSPITFKYDKHSNGGLAWGGIVGYQFNQWSSVEVGGYQFKKTSVTVLNQYAPPHTQTYKDRGYYVAARFTHADTFSDIGLFTKVGLGYRTYHATNPTPNNGMNSTNSWVPFFAAGMDYPLSSSMAITGQWAYFGGHQRHEENKFIPAISVLTVGFKYLFSM